MLQKFPLSSDALCNIEEIQQNSIFFEWKAVDLKKESCFSKVSKKEFYLPLKRLIIFYFCEEIEVNFLVILIY